MTTIDWTAIADPSAPLPTGTRARARALELRTAYQSALDAQVVDLPSLQNPDSVASALAPYAVGRAAESVWVLPVTSQCRACCPPIEIARGTADGCDLPPRDVYRAALRTDTAVGVIVAHNHPSCSDDISAADASITSQLIAAGRVVGIPLHDHLIITPRVEGYVSIRQHRPDLWG